MAHSTQDDTTFDPDLYLSPNEQDLLLTALNSNKPGMTDPHPAYSQVSPNGVRPVGPRSISNPQQPHHPSRKSVDTFDVYASPVQQMPGSASVGKDLTFDDSPYLDYELEDGNFDWDVNGDQMIGSLPGTSVDDEDADLHDKRKASDDDAEDNDGGGKRREGDDKTSKKPGRKPLTSEPTSKRKAQNRAAQRAFRERKERHLKELETKVEDLEKASESTNHENGMLRAQVDRLQSELKEYRKRINVNMNPTNRSSPQGMGQSMSPKSNWDINNNFQFEFPRFGSVSTEVSAATTKSNPPKRTTKTNDVLGAQAAHSATYPDKSGIVASPTSLTSPTRNVSQPKAGSQADNNVNDLSDLFSPSVLQNASRSNSADYLSYAAKQHRENSGSLDHTRASTSSTGGLTDYNTASPSASSVSQNGFTSSCVTTPEHAAESPEQRKASEESQRTRSEGETAFCDDFQKACGTKEDPVPLMMIQSNEISAPSSAVKTPGDEFHGIDWMAAQNGGTFDPILFGDYRDPQDNILNGAEFGAFFDDAFPTPDFASPSASSLDTALPRKKDLMQQIEDQQAGKDSEIVPGNHPKQFLNCNMLWDRVQTSEKLQTGEVDMDDLCSQLKLKAKCSGSGAVIDQKDVDAILGPAPDPQKNFLQMFR